MFASRLCRLCAPRPGRRIGGLGLIHQTDTHLVRIRARSHCGLCDSFSPSRLAIAGTGAPANLPKPGRSVTITWSERSGDVATRHAAVGAKRIHCGLGIDVPPDYERITSHTLVTPGRIRYPCDSSLAGSERGILPVSGSSGVVDRAYESPRSSLAGVERLASSLTKRAC